MCTIPGGRLDRAHDAVRDPQVVGARDLRGATLWDGSSIIQGLSPQTPIIHIFLAKYTIIGILKQIQSKPLFLIILYHPRQGYNELVDVYSWAMCMFEVLTGDAPFEEYSALECAYLVSREEKRPTLLGVIDERFEYLRQLTVRYKLVDGHAHDVIVKAAYSPPHAIQLYSEVVTPSLTCFPALPRSPTSPLSHSPAFSLYHFPAPSRSSVCRSAEASARLTPP